jgi:hypothetical protein
LNVKFFRGIINTIMMPTANFMGRLLVIFQMLLKYPLAAIPEGIQ